MLRGKRLSLGSLFKKDKPRPPSRDALIFSLIGHISALYHSSSPDSLHFPTTPVLGNLTTTQHGLANTRLQHHQQEFRVRDSFLGIDKIAWLLEFGRFGRGFGTCTVMVLLCRLPVEFPRPPAIPVLCLAHRVRPKNLVIASSNTPPVNVRNLSSVVTYRSIVQQMARSATITLKNGVSWCPRLGWTGNIFNPLLALRSSLSLVSEHLILGNG